MNNVSEGSERVIRRILVALDTSPHSEAALETAVQFAAAFDAELRGLFVEDTDLLRLAELPIAQEVHSFAQPARAMSTQRISRQLKRQAEQARRALERAARRGDVEYTFTVDRGRVSTKLLEAAAEADLIMLGKASAARCSRRKLGTTARKVIQNASAAVLVLREALRRDASLIVYYDGTSSAETALRLAAALAYREENHRPLTVLLPPDHADEAQRLRTAFTEQYGRDVSGRLHVRPLTRIEAARLATVTHGKGQCLVVLPATAPPLRDADVQQFLYELDCPALVVH